MALGVGVRDGLLCALAGASSVRTWANHGEDGSEVVEGLCKCDARVLDGDGDEFKSPPVFLEGRDEGYFFLVFSACFLSHPRFRKNPISMRMRVNNFLSKLVLPGFGVSGNPLT